MDPQKVQIWIGLGQQLIQVGEAGYEYFHNLLAKDPNIDTDNAQLDRTHDLYQGRIQQAQDAADGK
jgi:hypothetical protein